MLRNGANNPEQGQGVVANKDVQKVSYLEQVVREEGGEKVSVLVERPYQKDTISKIIQSLNSETKV